MSVLSSHLKVPPARVHELIEQRNFLELKKIFTDWLPADIGELIVELPAEEQVVVFRLLPHGIAAVVFEYLRHHAQKTLLEAMGREDVVRIVNEMSADDRTALLEELPAEAVKQLLRLLTPDQLRVAQGLLNYPEKSVGRLMTPDFIAVKETQTLKEVLDFIREYGSESETLSVIYVINDNGVLIDDVRIREFLLKPLDFTVKQVRDDSFVALKPTDTESTAAQLFKKYDRTALPVIDSLGKLVGIVTVDDILDVIEQQNTSDMQKMGGVESLDQPYLSMSVWQMTQKRAPWLVILFVSEMLTTTAMGFFEGEIAKAVVLALFLPLIISSGGNSGSQATTLIIRAMAIGEVTLKDWWRVMRREIFSGLFLGTILGVIGFIRIALWSQFSEIYGPHWELVGLTIFISLIGVVLWGTLSGSMLPFLLKKLRLDPATCSAPFVATLVDVTGLIIYFTTGMFILKGTLL